MPDVTRRRMVWLLGMGAGAAVWYGFVRWGPEAPSTSAPPADSATGPSATASTRPIPGSISSSTGAPPATPPTTTTTRAAPPAESATTRATAPAETTTTTGPPDPTTTITPSVTIPDPGTEVVVIGREGWGAAATTGPFTPHVLERMTVHHTAVTLSDDGAAPERVKGHQRFHQTDKGWPDLAYHFIIDRAGNVYEARPVEARGDTATAYDPTGHFLPCLEGDYDRQQPTASQLASLVGLLAWAAGEFGLPPETLSGHRDHAATTCPGDSVYARLDEIREAVRARLAAGPTGLRILTGDEARRRVDEIEA